MISSRKRISRRRRARGLRPIQTGLGLLLLTASGCRTTITYDPDPPEVGPLFQMPAQLDYAGAPHFLPRTVVASPGSTLEVRYRYRTRYDHSSNLQLLNPMLLLGFRVVGVDIHGSGRLEIGAPERSVESYEASCTMKMRRSVWIWGYPSDSELRDQALLAVRSMIEAEMLEDRSKLEALEVGAASRAAEAEQPRKE